MARGTTIKGKAFEYATCCAFATYLIGKKVAVDCEINSDAYRTAKRSFESLDESTQRDYRAAAEASIDVIIPLEPKLTDLRTVLLYAFASKLTLRGSKEMLETSCLLDRRMTGRLVFPVSITMKL